MSTINAGTTAATGLVLTTDTTGKLDLQLDGVTKATVSTSGNVGIGTTSPDIEGYGSGVTQLSVVNYGSDGQYGVINIDGYRTTDGTIGDLNFGILTNIGAGTGNRAIIQGLRNGANDAIAMAFRTSPTGGTDTERMRITSDGRIYGTALHNNAGAVTGTTNQYIASGTYTPTLYNTTNIASSLPRACNWMRVGNVVTVSGNVDVALTAGSVFSTLGMSLPIASTMPNGTNVGGTACSNSIAGNSSWSIYADTANNRAKFETTSIGVTGNNGYTFTFTYVVL